MNWKRIFLAALAVFVIFQITNLIINFGIMGSYYDSPGVKEAFRARDAMMRYMWVMWAMGILWSFFFTFIFAKGYDGKGIWEGIRYGIYIGFFFFYVNAFNQFVLYPIPYVLTWYWVLFGMIQSIILGITAALIYRPAPAAAA